MNYDKLNPVDTTANRLKHALEIRNKTQSTLARETGIDTAAMSRYVNGMYKPKNTAMHKLALALDVNEMWLYGYDVPMERSAEQKELDFKNTIFEKITKDDDLIDMITKYYSLDEKKQRMIRDWVNTLCE